MKILHISVLVKMLFAMLSCVNFLNLYLLSIMFPWKLYSITSVLILFKVTFWPYKLSRRFFFSFIVLLVYWQILETKLPTEIRYNMIINNMLPKGKIQGMFFNLSSRINNLFVQYVANKFAKQLCLCV